MTLPLAKRLAQRQVRLSGNKIANVSRGGKRINPRLAMQVLLEGTDQATMIEMSKVLCLAKGMDELKIVEFLNKNAGERVNPNKLSRVHIALLLTFFAKSKFKGTLKGLRECIKDSNPDVRRYAVLGLNELAEQGVNESLSGLILGSKETNRADSKNAYLGIRALSDKGNKAAARYLKKQGML